MKEVENELSLVKAGEATRIRSSRHIKYDKALTTAFSNFEQTNNGKELLRFAAHQAAKLDIVALDEEDYY